jgi:hypothetical protein
VHVSSPLELQEQPRVLGSELASGCCQPSASIRVMAQQREYNAPAV